MSLRVRFQGGARAGEVQEFPDSQERIVIGRDPAPRCDVVLPPDDKRVSREHCALERVLGKYRLVLKGTAPVFVNGRPAHDGQELEGVAQVQLGEGGPKLIVETVSASGLAPTEGVGRPLPGLHTQVERMHGRVARQRTLAVLAIVGVAAVGIGAWYLFGKAEKDVEIASAEVAATKGELARLRAEVERVDAAALTGDERKKMTEFLEQIAAPREEPPPPKGFADIVAAIEPSVYLVVIRDAAGEKAHGTAWVTEGGRLATNAHVAEAFDDLPAGGGLFVRSTGAESKDVRVVGITIHAGYRQFVGLASKYATADPAGVASLPLVPACDVALLHVAESDRGDLADPIPLAPAARLAELRSGDTVAYVGYPMEGLLSTDMKRPKPHAAFGHVTSVSDFFLARVDAAEALLVQHDLPAHGGSSGSPIVDDHGRVVAVHNAGNFAFVPSPAGDRLIRIPLAGINFGQRCDLLAALLDGSAESQAKALVAGWTPQLEQFRAGRADTVFARLVEVFRATAREQAGVEQGRVEIVATDDGTIEVVGPRAAVGLRYKAKDEGFYLVTAVARGIQDINMAVRVNGQQAAHDVSPDYFPIAILNLARGAVVEAFVYAANDGAAGAEFDFRVYRGTPK